MRAERSEKIRQLFEAALERDPEQRAEFLGRAFAEDPSIRVEVESLIASHEEAESLREGPTLEKEEETAFPPRPADVPREIGPYRIIREIGQGGMGSVYEAEQDKPVRRRVAVKLIKWGMDTKHFVARFASERQALALMTHSNIAAIYDAGATAGGRPYFAMEFVSGIPITKYCDTHRLTIRERLELFLQVCDGAQHAHQKGIIHRDIKPSNVLVTIQDGEPLPKIIDFGLAKATSGRLTDKSAYTELGQLVGTPEYMSPEQADITALDVDTRADIYSLGAVLYELLVGAKPLDLDILGQTSFVEMTRRILEEEPPRPSVRVSSMGSASQLAARNRRGDPRSLGKQLRGDLDWITMKTLEKERTRRYETASSLGQDLQRYLRHEPVRARAPTAAYRARKFIRRHQGGVAAAAAVLIALIFGLVSATAGMIRAREAERVAVREAATANEVSNFLVGVFEVADPSEALGRTITAHEILGKGAREIEKALSQQPEVQARLMVTMGKVYTNLGLYGEAEPLLTKAVETCRRVLGKDHPDTLTALNDLANLYYYQNRFAEAQPLYLELVQTRGRVLGEEDPATLRAQFDLASLYLWSKRYDEMEELSLKTLDAQRRVLGEDHPDTLDSMHNLASMYYVRGRYQESARVAERVLDQTRRRQGKDHPDTLTSMHNLATSYHGMGRYDEAEKLYREVIALKSRVLGSSHQQTADSIRMLGRMLKEQGRLEDAEALLLEAYGIYLESVGEHHTRTRETIQHLAELYEASGRPEKAAVYRAQLNKARP